MSEEKNTLEQSNEIRFENEIKEAITEAKKSLNLSENGLSELTGIKQLEIEKIEKLGIQTRIDLLMKLLVPIGYTIRVIPIEKIKK
ncbi:MAG: XRE family transcriptional regulator [Clostridia bacterium]|nr:XRE family transcriptional regulator [Clostridia bacterium]